jgi:hypothetical protein
MGFGCDIFPIDPEYEDENFRWIHDEEDEDEFEEEGTEREFDRDADDSRGGLMDDEDVPW